MIYALVHMARYLIVTQNDKGWFFYPTASSGRVCHLQFSGSNWIPTLCYKMTKVIGCHGNSKNKWSITRRWDFSSREYSAVALCIMRSALVEKYFPFISLFLVLIGLEYSLGEHWLRVRQNLNPTLSISWIWAHPVIFQRPILSFFLQCRQFFCHLIVGLKVDSYSDARPSASDARTIFGRRYRARYRSVSHWRQVEHMIGVRYSRVQPIWTLSVPKI
jgi:hypothetical protein